MSVPTVLNTSNCFVYGTSATGNALTVQQLGAGNVVRFSNVAGGSNVFVMDANGRIGVNQNTPITPLHVTATASNSAIFIDNSLGGVGVRPSATNSGAANCHIWANSVVDGTAGAGFLRIAAGGGGIAGQKSYIDLSGYNPVTDLDRNIVFGTLGTERMRIDVNGRVGIGTTSPGNTFQIGAVVDNIYANNPLAQSTTIILGNSPSMPTYSGTSTIGGTLFVNSTNTYASNVGASIALGGRSQNFGGGNQHQTFARIQGVQAIENSAYYGNFVIETNNSGTLYERMRIDSNGRVGIGTTSPGSPLQIQCGDAYQGGITLGSTVAGVAGSSDFMIQRGVSSCTVGGTTWNASNVMIFHTPNETQATTGNVGFMWMSSGSRIGMFYDTRNSRLGIGTKLPAQTLHIYGSMQIDRAASAYSITGTTTTYAAGTWYTLVPTGALTQNGATYLVTMTWQSNPGANPWTLSMSFLWYNQYCNDANASQLAGAAVPMAYHATNGSGDYQISIRAQSSSATYPAIQWKCNTALSNLGYWTAFCHIISY